MIAFFIGLFFLAGIIGLIWDAMAFVFEVMVSIILAIIVMIVGAILLKKIF